MGINIEVNDILALRNIREHRENKREWSECVPEQLIPDRSYLFHKNGYRVWKLGKKIPLVETEGNCNITRFVAFVEIVYDQHQINDAGEFFTTGVYRLIEVPPPELLETYFNLLIDSKPLFNPTNTIYDVYSIN